MFRKTQYKTNNRGYDIIYMKAYTPDGEFFKGDLFTGTHVISFSFFCDESKLISFHAHTASKEIQQLIVSCIEKNEKDKKNQTKE